MYLVFDKHDCILVFPRNFSVCILSMHYCDLYYIFLQEGIRGEGEGTSVNEGKALFVIMMNVFPQ
jgi:hypothetical protein